MSPQGESAAVELQTTAGSPSTAAADSAASGDPARSPAAAKEGFAPAALRSFPPPPQQQQGQLQQAGQPSQASTLYVSLGTQSRSAQLLRLLHNNNRCRLSSNNSISSLFPLTATTTEAA